MKKSVSLLLAALMLTGALAGCGISASTSTGAQDSSAADTGVSGAVTVISREDGSGTRGAFVELTGVEEKNADGQKVDNTTADAEIANKTDVVLTSVAGNEKAIGYISEPHAAIAWRALRDQLQPGDKFYIHMLDEVLAYEVDQILPMVEKDDMDTLTEAMKVDPDADQVTLFTCTPYGVNSHRLLVRGTRVPYTGEEEVQNTVAETMVQAVQNYYMLYLIMGLSVTILVILIMKFLFGRHKKQGGKRDDE